MTMNGAMPQVSWISLLAFIVFIIDKDIGTDLLSHKFTMDDTTLSECLQLEDDSQPRQV